MEDFSTEIDNDTDDLKSILGDAYDKALQEQDNVEHPKETVSADAHQDEPRDRDESGRFTKSEQEEKPEPEQPAEPEQKQIEAPDGWTAAQKIEWDKLPAEAQRIISDREMSFKQVQAKLKQFDPLEERLSKHDSHLAVAGTTRAQFLDNLVAAHEALLRDPSAIFTIARRYGINPAVLSQQQAGSEQQARQDTQHQDVYGQRLAALEAQQQQYIRAQQEQADQSLQSQIDAFAGAKDGDALKHPHFNDVKPMMGALLQAGQASGLDDAYAMACRAHPDVSRRIAEAATRAEQLKQQRVAEEAKRKGAASLSGAPQSRGNSAAQEGDLRSTIMDAMESAMK